MYKVEMTRGRKILFPISNKKLDMALREETAMFVKTTNMFLRELVSWLQRCEFDVIGFSSHGELYVSDSEWYIGPGGGFHKPFTHKERSGELLPFPKIKDSQLKYLFSYVFRECGCLDSHAAWKDNISASAINKLKAVVRRFKKQRVESIADYVRRMVPPQVTNGTIGHKKTLMRYKDGVIKMTLANRNIIEIKDFSLPQSMYKQIHKAAFGGNLTIKNKANSKNHCYTVLFNCDKTFYEPKKWIGMDINKFDPYWVVIAENSPDGFEEIIGKPNHIKELEDRMKEVDKKIGNKDRKSISNKQRTILREEKFSIINLYNKAVHNLLSDNPHGESFLDFLENNQYGVGLDGVQTKGYAFGQSAINPILIKECEKRRIPYFLTKAAYTTRDCYYCEARNKRPKGQDPYICENPICEKFESEEIPHVNAARNIAKKANAGFLGLAKKQSMVHSS